MKKKVLLIIGVFITIWWIGICLGYRQAYSYFDNMMIPKIEQLEQLKKEYGDIKKIRRGTFSLPKEYGEEQITVVYTVKFNSNKKKKIRFFLNVEHEEIVSFKIDKKTIYVKK